MNSNLPFCCLITSPHGCHVSLWHQYPAGWKRKSTSFILVRVSCTRHWRGRWHFYSHSIGKNTESLSNLTTRKTRKYMLAILAVRKKNSSVESQPSLQGNIFEHRFEVWCLEIVYISSFFFFKPEIYILITFIFISDILFIFVNWLYKYVF